MGRSPCCSKVGLRKGPWTVEEDQKLVDFIEEHGHGSWRALPAKAGLQRCGKSCRLRWTNYLRPDIKRGKFNLQEEQTIIQLHALLGNRWSTIATHLPKRTDNEIKNYWNTHLKKRLTKMGIDPVTHKPKSDALGSGHAKDSTNLSHMAQWESARLEAEARLVRESNLMQTSPNLMQTVGTERRSRATTLPCLDVLKAWQGAWSKPIAVSPSSNITCHNFANDDLESPTSTLSFIDHMVQIPTPRLVGPDLVGSSMVVYEAKQGGLMDNQTALGFQGLTWEDDNQIIVPDMFGFDGLDHGSAMVAAGPNPNINSTEEDCGGDFEDNKSYWDSILNMTVF